LPSNGSWQKVRFDQICKNISNRIDDPKQADTDYYVGLEHLDSEDPKILRHGSPQDVSKTKLLFKSGHILFGKRNWYLRRLAVAKRDGICSAHMLVLEPIEGKAIKEFVPLLMFSDDFFEKALMVSAGSMSPTIKWKDISPLEFLIPSILEQENILSITHKIDQSISNTQKLIEKTKIYFTSRRESLLTRGIGHTKFKKVPWYYGKTIEIPEEWAKAKCNDKIELKHGHQFRSEDFVNDGLKVIKIEQITKDGQIDLSNCDMISSNREKEFLDYLVKKDDILMAITGATLGKTAHVKEDVGLAYQNYRVANFYPKDQTELSKKFLYYLLSSEIFLKKIYNLINESAQPNLGKAEFENIRFVYPKNLKEQKQIISILSNIDEQMTQQQSHLSNLKIMRKSIINSKLTKEETIATK